MRTADATPALARLAALDLALCLRCNRLTRTTLLRLLTMVSHLGNGWLWYGLALSLPALYGAAAWPVVLRMLAVSTSGLLVYKQLKRRIARPRPYVAHGAITAWVAPLDRWAFPSGHTLHAVGLSWVICADYPELAVLLVPFSVLTAVSRIALGLHYPSDVAAGGTLGALLAALVLQVG